MNVEPTSTGSFQTTPLIITAGTNNPNGYTLYFSVADNSTALSGNNGSISALDNNGTTGYTPSTFTMNRWGYSIGTIASEDNDTTIYHPTPTISNPATIDTYVGAINSRDTTINLATKVDFATAAGSYSKQLVVSMLPTIIAYELSYDANTTDAVANLPTLELQGQWSDAAPTLTINTTKIPTRAGYNFKGYTTTSGGTTAEYAYNATTGAFTPSTLTPSTTSSTLYAVWEIGCTGQMLGGVCVTYMQDFANNADTIKNAMVLEQQYQFKDQRDDKTYYVAKLKDGNIWMTQNLDTFLTTADGGGVLGIDGTTVTSITPENSNVSAIWTPQNTTKTASTGSWSKAYSSAYSYDLGNQYFVTSGSTSDDTKYDSLSACTTAGHSQEVCEHGHYGNYYNWYAATAGSNAISMNRGDEAPQSICPKGWRLPYGTQANKSWYYMLSNSITGYGSNAATSQAMRTAPFYIPHAGYYRGSVYSVGSDGYYWSSTAYGENGLDFGVYTLYFYSSYVTPQNSLDATNSNSVRCVAL